MKTAGHSSLRAGLLVVIFSVIFVSQFFLDATAYFSPHRIASWLSEKGIFAPVIYMGLMVLAVVISPIPSLPLDVAAGAFFGPALGTAYSVAGASTGAVVSFYIARLLGREFIERFLGGHINFCSKCSDNLLTKIVFISRLLPVISFDVVSYGAGLTAMSARKFAFATFFGMIPLTFIYNYFGSVLVFGKGLSLIFGLTMVLLFFLIPRWLDRKGLGVLKHQETK